MRILFVNHTFPPESCAGSELCVLALAREFARRGHQPGVAYRIADSNLGELAVTGGEYEGIPVYKINHTFRFVQSFQDIYHNPALSFRFAGILRDFKPDVVHFHHLTNLSLTLPGEVRAYGCPSVMTLHDYWLLCQRGQLLRPGLELCHGPSERKCRSCLAAPLLRGRAQRAAARLSRWGTGGDRNANTLYDLRRLEGAEIVTPNRSFVGQMAFGGPEGGEPALLAHPPAEIRYPLRLGRRARLVTAAAMHPSVYGKPGGGTVFTVERNGERLVRVELNPKANPDHRRWHPVEIDLEPIDGETDILVLRTESDDPENHDFRTAGWRAPRIEALDPRPVPPAGAFKKRLRAAALKAAGALAHVSPRAREGIRHRRAWMERVWDDVDFFLSPSHFLREFFIRHGLDPAKTAYSPNGFVTVPPPPRREPAYPLRFGYIGTWIPSKGVDIALRAFQDIDPARARLIVRGFFPGYDGYENYEAELRSLAGPAVEWGGRYDPADTPALLAEWDAVIVPSIWWENSPLTVQEAFMAGAPVIAADMGGMAEQVRGGGGCVFRPRDPADLRRVAEELIADPSRLDAMRASIPPVRAIENQADELLERYGALIAGRESSWAGT